jgi:hypothetical protein
MDYFTVAKYVNQTVRLKYFRVDKFNNDIVGVITACTDKHCFFLISDWVDYEIEIPIELKNIESINPAENEKA